MPCSSTTSTQIDDKKIGCWNLLQQHDKNTSHEAYVHPLTKLSTSFMTKTSLEMCTEILGCETGCITEPATTQERDYTNTIKIKPRKTRKRTKYMSTFPPPLTSISSGGGVKVEAHRGGGRLVITAFTSSAGRVHFKSERENGRLRLFLRRRRSEQDLAGLIKENGGRIGRSFKCGDASGTKNLTSLPLCVAFS